MERKADVKEIVNDAIAYENSLLSRGRSRALSTPSICRDDSTLKIKKEEDVGNLRDSERRSPPRFRRFPPPTKRRDRQTRGGSLSRSQHHRNRRREGSVFSRLGTIHRNRRNKGPRRRFRQRHKPYDSLSRSEDNLSVKVLQARKMALSIQEHREKTKIIEKKMNDEKNILDEVYARLRKLKRQKEDNERDRGNYECRFERLCAELRLKDIYWNGDFRAPIFKRPDDGPDDSSLLEESEEDGELLDDDDDDDEDEWSDDETFTDGPDD
ncbi:Oidioi.mRNA.OKI2018_I69.chr1.g741.t1.cds [Oikopleura dioica]|uniref:Oidioi.mRNA.OKI2018_I69.chr1.g741.t1.cds n=1 Tax=Oikopleura dioica TaxID=34765 RepID=A0ABN7SQ09_OIKDI|nr:Oidioi.mRNA.OKI2018_I69.chr1.g741.t1.cds [Oikopleura dioica]